MLIFLSPKEKKCGQMYQEVKKWSNKNNPCKVNHLKNTTTYLQTVSFRRENMKIIEMIAFTVRK